MHKFLYVISCSSY